MVAPTGLVVAWLVVAFLSTHGAAYLAHRGELSAFWVAAYIVSLAVPIWSACATAAVATAVAFQALGVMTAVSLLPRVPARAGLIALTVGNYLVWGVSCAETATPSFSTLVATASASVALILVAVLVPVLAKIKLE